MLPCSVSISYRRVRRFVAVDETRVDGGQLYIWAARDDIRRF